MPDEKVESQEETTDEPEAQSTEVIETPAAVTPEQGETFDRKYVEDLRTESAKYRKRAQAAEDKVKEHDQAQMGELEKAQAQAKDWESQYTQSQNLLAAERTRNAVTLEATRMNFRDAADALAMIDIDDLNHDEDTNRPTTKSVQGALKKLISAKPYLVDGNESTSGSADGGARGEGAGELTREQKVAQYEKELQETYGTVTAPAV
jgi:hypothetical protein